MKQKHSDLPLFRSAAARQRTVRYRAWRDSSVGRRVWERVVGLAYALVARQERRVSTKRLVEMVRAELLVDIDNSFSALMADDLVALDPVRFAERVERRKRTG